MPEPIMTKTKVDTIYDKNSNEGYLAIIAKAVEKQVAMKPIKRLITRRVCGHEYFQPLYACPSCDNKNLVEKDKRNFCPDCGQHLDWSEDVNIKFREGNRMNSYEFDRKVYSSVLKIYKHYGRTQQLRQTQEECAELIVAINKLFRDNQNIMSVNKANDNFLEELADVEIMLVQCKIMVQEAERSEEYRDVLIKKLARQAGRMGEAGENETKGLCSGD